MITIWKRLWPELIVYRWTIAFVLFTGAFISGLKSLTPEIIAQLQEAWKSGDTQRAYTLPFALGGAWIIASIFTYFHLFWMKYTGERIAVKFRKKLMEKYLSLNMSFRNEFDKGSGGLMSRMLNDIYLIQDGINNLAAILREPFLIIGALTYSFYLDWQLTLLVVIALPLVIVALKQIAKSLRKYGHLNQESMEDLTKTLKESLDGSRIVQSFNLEKEMSKRFNKNAESFLSFRRKIISREEFSSPLSEVLTMMTVIPLLLFIGYKIYHHQFAGEEFTSFLVAIGLLADSVKKMQNAYVKLQQCSVALERMDQVLDYGQIVPQLETPKKWDSHWQEIEYRNVSFSYGDNQILNNINLKVKRGEIVALVGESGGGKSTMVNLLERFIDPTQGEILIGGISLSNLSLTELRDNIALVSQDVFLFNDSIKKNVAMGNLSRDEMDVSQAISLANAKNFIEKFPDNIETKVGESGSRLSGGEKQRISIARAMFKDAPILILDEATSALDSSSEIEVQKGLEKLMEGRTAFVIAHRLSTIQKADRILVLKDGQITEQGTHTELLELGGQYSHYHLIQSSQ